jgi:hypothetical protein
LPLPFTTSHPSGTAFNPDFQQTGAGNTQQPSITAASANVTVDFAKRQINEYPIPSTFLGVGGVGLKLIVRNNSDGNAIRQANFHLTKLGDYDFMSQIFPTASSVTNPAQQDWSLFDTEMTLAANYNMQPLISLEYTPTWLQPQNQSPPQPNPCLLDRPQQNAHAVKPMYLVNGQDQGPQK